jgi:hypothetical protein
LGLRVGVETIQGKARQDKTTTRQRGVKAKVSLRDSIDAYGSKLGLGLGVRVRG